MWRHKIALTDADTAERDEEGEEISSARLVATTVTFREEQESFAGKYLVLSDRLSSDVTWFLRKHSDLNN